MLLDNVFPPLMDTSKIWILQKQYFKTLKDCFLKGCHQKCLVLSSEKYFIFPDFFLFKQQYDNKSLRKDYSIVKGISHCKITSKIILSQKVPIENSSFYKKFTSKIHPFTKGSHWNFILSQKVFHFTWNFYRTSYFGVRVVLHSAISFFK